MNDKQAKIVKLHLNTPVNTRKSLTRILRIYQSDNMESQKFRDLIYGFSKVLEYWKFEKEIEIEQRIIALEEKVSNSGA